MSIKNLKINQENKKIVADFCKYLKVMGYKFKNRPHSSVKELLYRMEQQQKNLSQITSEDIKEHDHYLRNRPNFTRPGTLSEHTITGYLFSLKVFFIYTEKIGLTSSNPMSVLNFPNAQKTQRTILSKSEIKQLYTACENETERAMLALFYGCGLRKSEAENLNIRDVDFRNNLLYVRSGKGKKRRVIPMTDTVSVDLKNYRFNERPQQHTRWTKTDDKKAFMLNKIGTRMSGLSHWTMFKNLLKRSSIKKGVSLHHLRHSIATHLLSEGMSIEQVRDFLGHQFLESTQIYTRVNLNQLPK